MNDESWVRLERRSGQQESRTDRTESGAGQAGRVCCLLAVLATTVGATLLAVSLTQYPRTVTH